MKHVKKLLLLVAILAIIVQGAYSAPLGVTSIDIIDQNTLKVTLSENPNLAAGDQDAELTLLRDMKLRGAVISENAANEVELLIEDPILPNTNYSLLSVLGAEGSIDFTTPDAVEGYVANNVALVSEQDIQSIEVLDDRTLLISYTEDIVASSLEYKFLSESIVTQVEKRLYDVPELFISIEPPLVDGQDYILMFIEMQDVDGNYLEFDTGIYDFQTPETEISEDTMETGTGMTMQEETTSTGTIIEDSMQDDEETMQEEVVEDTATEEETSATGSLLTEESDELMEDEINDLEAAGDENTSLQKETESVAMTADATPDTGAETWVLILATLIINTFYYYARRKKTQLA